MRKLQLVIGILTVLIAVAIGILSGVVSLPTFVKATAWPLIGLCVLAQVLLEIWKQYLGQSPSPTPISFRLARREILSIGALGLVGGSIAWIVGHLLLTSSQNPVSPASPDTTTLTY